MLLLKGTSEQAVVDAINAANSLPLPINVGDLYFSQPTPIASGYVSVPTVTQYNYQDYTGYRTFEYMRIDLSKVFGTLRPVVQVPKTSTLGELIPIMNKTLGLSLDVKDIVDQSLSWGTVGSQQNLQFSAAPKSLGYQGRFVVQCILTRVALMDAIKRSVLDALKHPDPVSNKKSLSMMTWGIDFTDDLDNLLILRGLWRSPVAVADLMASKGFPNYPQAAQWTLSIQLTKDVPSANKAFTHVIIQPNVDTSTYKGSGYFHFNLL